MILTSVNGRYCETVHLYYMIYFLRPSPSEAGGGSGEANDVAAAMLLALLVSVVGNAYDVLGVSPDASDQAIRAAYRRAALANHPDKVGKTTSAAGRSAAARRMELINEAYAAIGEPEARSEYDRSQLVRASGGSSSGGYTQAYRRPPVQVRLKVACSLEEMGGFAPVTIDLESVLGSQGGPYQRIPPLRHWLPPGCAVGDVVRIPLSGVGIDLMVEVQLATHAERRLLHTFLKPCQEFSRHRDDLDTKIWLPAWHNARWWRRRAYVRTICGRRVQAVRPKTWVTSGEVVTLDGLGMPIRQTARRDSTLSPFTSDRGALKVEVRLRSWPDSLRCVAGSGLLVATMSTALVKLVGWTLFRRRRRRYLEVRLWTGPSPFNVGKPFRIWGRSQLYTYQWIYN